MSKQRAHWAITIKEDNFETWDSEKRSEFLSFAGKYINLQGKRIIMQYNDTTSYRLAVGFKEKEDSNTSSTHWHCLFSCEPGKTCTAGRVRIVMKGYGMPIVNEYVQVIDTSPFIYMKYANKESSDPKTKRSQVDDIIKNEFKMLKSKSTVSREMFNSYLCDKYGATWLTRNKSIIDTYCSIQEECYAERIIIDDEDVEIESRIKNIFNSFHDNILYQLNQPGHFITKCDALNNVEINDIAKYITFISFIPYLFQRATKVIDFIPGLYFYGDANCGKSFAFQLGKSYKIIATDSNGVGKFKLETCESAYLLDDVKHDFVDTSFISSTLRQLTLGAYTRIKIHSETKQIKGFVAVTSNDKPSFITDDYDEKNRNAWLRRFIVLKFKQNNNLDEIILNGNELEYKISQTAITPLLLAIAQDLKNKYSNTHRVNKSIELYVKHLAKYTQQQVSSEEIAEGDGSGSNLDYSVGNSNETKELKRKLIYYNQEDTSDNDGHDVSERVRKKLEFEPADDESYMRR